MSSIDKKSKAEAPSLLTLVMALGLGSLLLLYRGRLVLGFALFGVLVLAMGTIGQPDNRNVRILGEDGVVAAGAKSYTLSVLADESVDPSKVIFRRVDGDRTSVLPGTPVRNKAGTRILFKVKQSLKDVGLHTFEAELVKRVDVRTNSAKQKNIPVTREVSVSKTQMNVLACANTKVVVTDVEYALTKSWGRNFAVRPARQNVAQDGARAGLEALGKEGLSVVYVTRARPEQLAQVRSWLKAWKFPDGPVLFRANEHDGPMNHRARVGDQLRGAFANVELAVASVYGGANASAPYALYSYILGAEYDEAGELLAVDNWSALVKDYLRRTTATAEVGIDG